jgi:transcriptional regulator with XRE-family HTH domain
MMIMAGGPATGPARLRLAGMLEEDRRSAGLTQTKLAELAGYSHQTTASKIGRGEQLPRADQVKAWAAACRVDELRLADLLAALTAAGSEYEDWPTRHARAGGGAAFQAAIGDLESRTEQIVKFQPAAVPGLLQSPGYTIAILEATGVTGAEADGLLARRLERQQVLWAPGKQVSLLMLEGVLRHPLCGPEAMREQLARIAMVAEDMPRVQLGIVPFWNRLTIPVIAGFSRYDDLVIIELPSGDQEIAAPDQVEAFLRQEEALRAAAVFGHDAAGLCREAARQMPQ